MWLACVSAGRPIITSSLDLLADALPKLIKTQLLLLQETLLESKKSNEEIIAIFEKKRKRMIRLDIPTVLFFIGAVYTRFFNHDGVFGIPSRTIFLVCISIILSNIIFSMFTWRCPSCNRFLGRAWSPNFCSRCGARLHYRDQN